MRWTVFLLASVIAACSDSSVTPDLDGDVSTDASSDARVDGSGDSSACTCVGVTPCCDGCLARNVGVACDDGLSCVAGSTCGALGRCNGGAPVDCAAPQWPACSSVTCAEPGGCASTPINEGGSCDDGNAATYDDRCSIGSCSGTPCECTSGACCDGCHFVAADTPCGVAHVAHDDVCYVTPGGANYPKNSWVTRDFQALRCTGASAVCPASSTETFRVSINCADSCPNAGNCSLGCRTQENNLPSMACAGPASCTVDDPDFMPFDICRLDAWPH